jgi:hypothetical protein
MIKINPGRTLKGADFEHFGLANGQMTHQTKENQ